MFCLISASCSLMWNLGCFFGKYTKTIFLSLIPTTFEILRTEKTMDFVTLSLTVWQVGLVSQFLGFAKKPVLHTYFITKKMLSRTLSMAWKFLKGPHLPVSNIFQNIYLSRNYRNISLQSHFLTYSYTIWKNQQQNMTGSFKIWLTALEFLSYFSCENQNLKGACE